MATDALINDVLPPLPMELHPNVDHLVTEDDTPVDNIFSEKQQRLLTEPLYASWPGPGEDRPFVAMANVALYFAINQPPYVPDVLLALNVEVPADLWPKSHRSYFLFEYGKPPDVVIEVVSNSKGGEDSEKLAGYANARVPYYVVFDPDRVLSAEVLRAYQLDEFRFRKMDGPVWFPGLGLGLRIWEGQYENHADTWLRWVDAEGRLVPTGRERADRLAAKLRRLGVDPEAP
jgi:Uma2 family endonuclease